MTDTMEIDVTELTKSLVEACRFQTNEIKQKVQDGIDKIGKETLKEVKKLSPVYQGAYPDGVKYRDKGQKGGTYRKGWELNSLNRNGTVRNIISNKHYSHVHLLELGHDLLDKNGEKYGYVSKREHVSIAQKHAEEKVDKLLEDL